MEYYRIELKLEHLSNPFTFFSDISNKAGVALESDEEADLKEQHEGDNPYHSQEKELERNVDEYMKTAVKKVGYREVPWYGICYIALIVQMLLAILS